MTSRARALVARTSRVGVSPCQLAAIAIKCALRLTPSFAPQTSHTGEASRTTVYAYPFSYHRAKSLAEASKLLQELGEESRVVAGGQSLIPLMKMRMARPTALVDINFVAGLSAIESRDG